MASMANIYADNLLAHFRVLYAAWPPGSPINLGDYGKMAGNIFMPIGNIEDKYGIKFKIREDLHDEQYEYKSANNVEVSFTSAGSATAGTVSNIKAGMDIKFTGENAVFFNAAGCSFRSISDQVALGDQVMELWKEGKWLRDHVVVTNVVDAKSTTIAISGGTSGLLSLEAKAEGVQNIDLADASIGLRIKAEKNIGLRVINDSGLTPLIGLSRIKRIGDIFGHKYEFGKAHTLMVDVNAVDLLEEEEEEVSEVVRFGQLTYTG